MANEIIRYFVSVSYDGTNFAGWQKQKDKRSVQGEIEKVLSDVHTYPVLISGSGRTDAQVHAISQVFHFDSELLKIEKDVKKALDGLLPTDIVCNWVNKVDKDYHARYDCISKKYRYIINDGLFDVFRRNYECYVKNTLDVELIKEASLIFVGEHDFSALCTNRKKEKENQVRIIYSITVDRSSDGRIVIDFYGNGFLRHMVRMIVQVLIEVGLKRIDICRAKAMLDSKDKAACQYKADAKGLYLMEVNYDQEK
ncbi:MAG: tRNA pseudouridine(38-40) synthase TruA [Erysipelotrichaceae bacterium]